MKKALALLTILLVGFAFVATAADEEITLTGWVADEACAKDFARAGTADHKGCATGCLNRGDNVALALEDSLRLLDIDAETALQYAATEVVVKGVLDEATNTIKVTSIQAKE